MRPSSIERRCILFTLSNHCSTTKSRGLQSELDVTQDRKQRQLFSSGKAYALILSRNTL
jgi:hypothetical protein